MPHRVFHAIHGMLAFAGLLAVSAQSQSVTFLAPDRFDVAVFEHCALRLDTSPTTSDPASRSLERVDHLYVRAAGNQQNVHRPRPGPDGSFRLQMVDGGVALCGFDAVPRTEAVATDALRLFLAEHTNTLLGHTPRRTQTVRRIECGKALVRVHHPDESVPHSATAQSKTGQPVEIRPLADPTSLRTPSDLPLRIYLPPRHEGPARVIATHLPSGESRSLQTRPGGIVQVRLDRTGPWRVEAHHVRAEEDDAGLDWTIASATLTFDVAR